MACLIIRLRSRIGHPRAVISNIAEVCAVCFLGRVFVSRLSIFSHRYGRVFVNILVQRWKRMTEERLKND